MLLCRCRLPALQPVHCIFYSGTEEQFRCYCYILTQQTGAYETTFFKDLALQYKNINIEWTEISPLSSQKCCSCSFLCKVAVSVAKITHISKTPGRAGITQCKVRESHWGWRVQCLMTDELMQHIWQHRCLLCFPPYRTWAVSWQHWGTSDWSLTDQFTVMHFHPVQWINMAEAP